jgi:hypothetical protein
MPEELTFEFLFDNTGIIDGKPKKEGVFGDVNHFRRMLTEYQGKSHEPYHLKLVWGNLIFKGRAIELSITYKLFNPDGQPIRAVAKTKFQGSIEEKKRAAKDDRSSPDLTHQYKVKAGDSLPLLCYRIYGDPRHYLQVAASNRLVNEKSEPLRTWKVAHAIPKKWTVSDLNANENALVIETMELSYRYFTIQ